MLTKKYYEMIADGIKAASFPMPFGAHHNYDGLIREAFARCLAVHFEDDNPKFDRARFLKACGVA